MRLQAAAPARRRGFTTIEMMFAAILMGVVGMLLAQSWTAFGRPAISALARAKLAQEANLAAESLARDVGILAAPAGVQADSRYQNAQATGSTLVLTVDEGDGTVRTITYSIDGDDPGKLFRTDSDGRRVVAKLVTGFACQTATLPLMDGGGDVSGVKVELTLSHRTYDRNRDGSFRGDHTRRYTLFIPDPQ